MQAPHQRLEAPRGTGGELPASYTGRRSGAGGFGPHAGSRLPSSPAVTGSPSPALTPAANAGTRQARYAVSGSQAARADAAASTPGPGPKRARRRAGRRRSPAICACAHAHDCERSGSSAARGASSSSTGSGAAGIRRSRTPSWRRTVTSTSHGRSRVFAVPGAAGVNSHGRSRARELDLRHVAGLEVGGARRRVAAHDLGGVEPGDVAGPVQPDGRRHVAGAVDAHADTGSVTRAVSAPAGLVGGGDRAGDAALHPRQERVGGRAGRSCGLPHGEGGRALGRRRGQRGEDVAGDRDPLGRGRGDAGRGDHQLLVGDATVTPVPVA